MCIKERGGGGGGELNKNSIYIMTNQHGIKFIRRIKQFTRNRKTKKIKMKSHSQNTYNYVDSNFIKSHLAVHSICNSTMSRNTITEVLQKKGENIANSV
jgi:hypothetical protein